MDYNHAFNAGGYHTLKGGFGFQHTINDINSFYPGGYVFIFWDRSSRSAAQTTGRGKYGYYEVNDRRITNKAGANIHSLYMQDQWTVGDRLTLNLGLRTENEKCRRSGPTSPRTRSSSGLATSWRHGWARPTTCGATAG